MTTSTNQKPAAKIRDGAIAATLWKKEGENGVFFNTTISRTYKDGETFKDTGQKKNLRHRARAASKICYGCCEAGKAQEKTPHCP